MTLTQLLAALKSKILLMSFILIFTVAATAYVATNLPKKYSAEASLVLNNAAFETLAGNKQAPMGFLTTQVDIIKSQNVALNVVKNLSLNTNPAYINAYNNNPNTEISLDQWIAQRIINGLFVQPSQSSNVLKLGYSAEDPILAATMANAFADAFIQTNIEMKTQPSKRTSAWFERQLEEMRTDLQLKRELLSNYQKTKKIVSTDEKGDVRNSKLSQLSSDLIQEENNLLNLRTQLRSLQSGNYSDVDLINDGLVNQLKIALSNKEIELTQLKQRVSINHPSYLSLIAEIDGIKDKLNAEIQAAKLRIENAVKISSRTVWALKAKVGDQTESLLSINEDRNQLENLERDVQTSEKIYTMATERYYQTKLEAQLNESDASILTYASVPSKYSSPKIPLMIFLSFFLGLFLAITIAFIIEIINKKVRIVDDLKELDLPILGLVPKVKSYTKGK